jgi:protein-tyrosine phosphatase
MKVLFVCLGNICRSPLSEVIFNKHCSDLKISHLVSSDSCGTGNWHQGEMADKRSIKVANLFGLTMPHLARQIIDKDLDIFDYILVMDNHNKEDVLKEYPKAFNKVKLLSQFSEQHFEKIVPDPYWGDDSDFLKTYELLNELTLEFVLYLKNKHIDQV